MSNGMKWYKIEPGQSKEFRYIGNLIPNQLNVKNLDAHEGGFSLTSVPHGWVYHGRLAPNGLVALLVQFPRTNFIFSNSPAGPIEVSGENVVPV
jgi:hypothetical protein